MFEAKLRVIYGDTDKMGVVYYANYFRYFELARSEYFRARGGSYRALEQEGFGLPVIQAHCDYRQPARYDDLLAVRTRITERRRTTLRFEYEIVRDGEDGTLAHGHTVHICVGKDGKPSRLPEALVAILGDPDPGR
jgi:acyl-CoA thioester hydrolase